MTFITLLTLLWTLPLFGHTIELQNYNTVTLRHDIDEASIDRAIREISTVPGKEVVLYLYSPGGSIREGGRLIDFIRAVDKKVICIADITASMAFVILQSCHERYAMSASILMQHQPSFELGPDSRDNQKSLLRYLFNVTDEWDEMQAARLGIPLKDFQALVKDDWWLSGKEAVKYNVVDKLANVTCSSEMFQQTEVIPMTILIFNVEVEYSRCPLLTSPVSVKMAGGEPPSEEATQHLNSKLGAINDLKEKFRTR